MHCVLKVYGKFATCAFYSFCMLFPSKLYAHCGDYSHTSIQNTTCSVRFFWNMKTKRDFMWENSYCEENYFSVKLEALKWDIEKRNLNRQFALKFSDYNLILLMVERKVESNKKVKWYRPSKFTLTKNN